MSTLNKPSILLSSDENKLIFSLLGNKCSTLATAVVERYEANCRRNDSNGWIFADVGVICFVKDVSLRSYFFRLYCPNRQQLIWEHELYNFMEYQKLNYHLYAFEAEDCIVGFNFANDDEANNLYKLVTDKLKNRKGEPRATISHRKYDEVESISPTSPKHFDSMSPNKEPNIEKTISQRKYDEVESISPTSPKHFDLTSPMTEPNVEKTISFTQRKKKVKKKGVKISKDMIGLPTDFIHLTHYGLDSKPNFNYLKDEHLQTLFRNAGITEKHLKDEATCNLIYQVIEDHGGMEAVKEEVGPIISKGNMQPNATFYQPPLNIPAPPPPKIAPPVYSPPPNIPPPLPPNLNIPPPPSLPCPTPPPITVSPPNDAPMDSRSALLQAIKSGTKLKPVSAADGGHLAPQGMSSNVSGSRESLLEEIKHGVKLHSVSESKVPKAAPRQRGGLASALAEALAIRATAILSDSDSEESSSDKTDWEE